MAALQAGIPSTEQAEWLASLRLDPPEEDRADVRHAILVSSLTGKKPDDILAVLPWRARSVTAPPPSPAQKQANLRKRIDLAMRAFQDRGSGRRKG